jgi:hypothetical protein
MLSRLCGRVEEQNRDRSRTHSLYQGAARPSVSGERRAIRESELRQDKQRGHDSRKPCRGGQEWAEGREGDIHEKRAASARRKRVGKLTFSPPGRECCLPGGWQFWLHL